MNFYAFSAVIIALTCVFSAFIVFIKNPRGPKNLIYLPISLTTALWALFYALWQMSTTYDDALRNIRLSIAFAVMAPVFNFHFLIKFLDFETPRRKLFLRIFYVISGLIFLSSQSHYFIPRVEQKLEFPFWPVPGPLMHAHFINLFVPSIWSLYLVWKKSAQSSPLVNNKLKWLLVSWGIGYFGAMSNNPLWYNIPVRPYENILTVVPFIIMPLLFFRLSTLDLGYLVRRFFANIFQFFIMGLFTLLLLSVFVKSWKQAGLVFLASLLTEPLVFAVNSKYWKRFWGRFNKSRQEKIEERKHTFQENTFTYDDLAQNLVQSMMSILPISLVAVYMEDLLKNDFSLRAQTGMKNPAAADLKFNRSELAIPHDDPLIKHFGDENKIVNLEEMLNALEMEDIELPPLATTMRRIEGELCVPLYFGDRVRGLLVLGRKTNNTLFNQDDYAAIDSFVQLGTDIMRFIYGMETELSHTALYSHDMNHNIRAMMQAIQFLDSPMAETQTKERLHNVLQQADEVARQLYTSFQRNRDRSTLIMKTMRGEYEKQPVNVGKLLETSAGKFALQASKENLTLKIDIQPAAFDMPGNKEDLVRVFDNLIANAFRYIKPPEGLLEVIGRNANFSYEIVIRDNGEGIDPQDLSFIWKWGWQASQGKKGDSGLGLAISKQIIQIHNGTISASSEGKDKGTAFTISFKT